MTIEVELSHVRVRLVWTDADTKDEKLDHQITVDLMIDRKTRSCVGKHPVFGIYGSPVREDVYPFILRADGTVDYGDNAEILMRFNKFNVRDRKIEVGELTTYEETDDNWCCRIVDVTDLATGRPC